MSKQESPAFLRGDRRLPEAAASRSSCVPPASCGPPRFIFSAENEWETPKIAPVKGKKTTGGPVRGRRCGPRRGLCSRKLSLPSASTAGRGGRPCPRARDAAGGGRSCVLGSSWPSAHPRASCSVCWPQRCSAGFGADEASGLESPVWVSGKVTVLPALTPHHEAPIHFSPFNCSLAEQLLYKRTFPQRPD